MNFTNTTKTTTSLSPPCPPCLLVAGRHTAVATTPPNECFSSNMHYNYDNEYKINQVLDKCCRPPAVSDQGNKKMPSVYIFMN